MGWEPGTSWRQGHVLTRASAEELGFLTADDSQDARIVVVSHDCDLDHRPDQEPLVEAIRGSKVGAADGNLQHARSARTLHIDYECKFGGVETIELKAKDKIFIEKAKLADHLPCAQRALSYGEKYTLQNWLSARYFRAAFPTEFNDRMSKSRFGLDEPFRKILKKAGRALLAVYFHVDFGEDVERSDGDNYRLDIYLVYSVEGDPIEARDTVEKARAEIEKLFKSKCHNTGQWVGIELVSCSVEAESVITLHQARMLRRWHADYLSLRGDPPDAMANT